MYRQYDGRMSEPCCGDPEIDEPSASRAEDSDRPDTLICYCFAHTRGEIGAELRAHGETTVPRRITAQIKAGNCSCEVLNPSGRCCLGEVNRVVELIRARMAEAEPGGTPVS